MHTPKIEEIDEINNKSDDNDNEESQGGVQCVQQ